MTDNDFSHTQRALARDGFGAAHTIMVCAICVLGAWLSWLFLSKVTVVETTRVARLERVAASRPVAAPASGRIARSHLALGKRVAAGDVLVELDSTDQRLELDETRARVASIRLELEAVKKQRTAEQARAAEGKTASSRGQEERAARLRSREVALALARDELASSRALVKTGSVSEAEVSRARADVNRIGAEVESLRHGARRLAAEEDMRASGGQVELEELAQRAARLEGDLAVAATKAARLEHEIERRTVRAPVDGTIASTEVLPAGTLVREGDVVAVILPGGAVRIIAHFSPQAAFGRLRAGQRAWMRLDGFPWTQHGVLPARVAVVATETRHGKVRVELDVLPDPPRSIPLEHGLPGSVEVEVERVSPATLALRAAGAYLGQAP